MNDFGKVYCSAKDNRLSLFNRAQHLGGNEPRLRTRWETPACCERPVKYQAN